MAVPAVRIFKSRVRPRPLMKIRSLMVVEVAAEYSVFVPNVNRSAARSQQLRHFSCIEHSRLTEPSITTLKMYFQIREIVLWSKKAGLAPRPI